MNPDHDYAESLSVVSQELLNQAAYVDLIGIQPLVGDAGGRPGDRRFVWHLVFADELEEGPAFFVNVGTHKGMFCVLDQGVVPGTSKQVRRECARKHYHPGL